MESHINRRRYLKGMVTRIENAVTAQGATPWDMRSVTDYLQQVNKLWNDVSENHEEVALLCNDDATYEPHQIEFDHLATRIETLRLKFPAPQAEPPNGGGLVNGSVSSNNNNASAVRLPKLELPTFSGSLHEWTSFHDLFTATINNNDRLAGAQKLQYLKASLKGEAALLVQTIQITDENFSEAWDILKKRYQNKREIINAHLKRLFSQPTLTTESPTALRKLIDVTSETVRALRVMQIPVDQWDIILSYLILEKVDPDTRRQWELTLTTTEIVKFSDLMSFLEQRARALLSCGATRSSKTAGVQERSTARPAQQVNRPFPPPKQSYHAGASKEKCRICGENHAIYHCNEFLQSSVENRRQLVRTNTLCYNCLSGGHQWKACKSSGCRKCGGKHHTFLHEPKTESKQKNSEEQTPVTTHHGYEKNSAHVLLATALVRIQDVRGGYQVCRALLDSGSQATFITEDCAQRLALPRQRTNMTVTGISDSDVNVSKGSIILKVSSCLERGSEIQVNALVLKKVTGTMPSAPCDVTTWNHLPATQLADPDYHTPNSIDVLLGADVLADVIRHGLRRGPQGTPTAQRSTFGWLISGRVSSNHVSVRVTTNTAQLGLEESVQRFWELEDVPRTKVLTEEEKQCEEHFVMTHERTSDGRFVVRLPLKVKPVVMDSRETRVAAVKRLAQVNKRLATNPQEQQQYHNFLQEYAEMGHMRQLTVTEAEKHNSIYLPHHAVIKESSSTTRLRVVFDASAKGRQGASLNDHLMVGPTLQDDIFNILVRFRTHAIAITADITKMYRQVWIHTADTHYQNIVWQESPSQSIKDYRLLTLTYGTASAPYLATRCLQQLARDNGGDLPGAAEATLRDFYVDDLMSGACSEGSAIDLREQLSTLLSRGGFELRKWASNSKTVLDSVPVHLREESGSLPIEADKSIKTLGLQWIPNADQFMFTLSPPGDHLNNSKRSMLSTMAKIYDPMGWLAPITVKAKIMLQQLWRTPCTWDERLPPSVEEEWIQFREDLIHIESLRIPRRLSQERNESEELHGFCDASEKAYAAVIYLKSMDHQGKIHVTLIAAKTRVAPLKTISIPRLELCSALLLANLFQSVQLAFTVPVTTIFAWTDSTVALAWINASSSRWKTFVANRVTKIQAAVEAQHWHHVKGGENPADCASRGINPTDMMNHKLWWTGPEWLQHSSANQQTKLKAIEADPQISEEERSSLVAIINPAQDLLSRFSSLNTLMRVTVYVFRFIRNCRSAVEKRMSGSPSTEELNQALFFWIKGAQEQEFPEEIRCLKKQKPVPSESRLFTLSPFMDSQGIIRVGGRLLNSSIQIDQKHPIILPKKNTLTTLIVRYEHLRNLHAGPQLLLCSLQQRYWIIGGRDLVRQHVQQCVPCWRQRAKPTRPMMGDLPAARVTPARPFLRCGVDYAGPLLIRALKLRGQKTFKAYVALFVCFSTHAIHLELVSDLTTDAFIAALKRFISRRGNCSEIHSDQGTNFIGANRELKELQRFIQTPKHNQTVSKVLGESGTAWHFNPPAAPHFGGLWEAGVKSIKFHLRRIVGNVTLNFEEMSTVLTQIEACVNSRPLCPASRNPGDLSALTPGHFLIGGPITAMAEPDYTTENISRLSRWQLVQRLYQHFWKRWSQEYLSRLQQRPRSWINKTDVKTDDLVLIKDENQPPSRWRLGRITQIHPGKDGVIRVVTIKTETGELRRPVVKICQLPIE